MERRRQRILLVLAWAVPLLAGSWGWVWLRVAMIGGEPPWYAWVLSALFPVIAVAAALLANPKPDLAHLGMCMTCAGRLHRTRKPGDPTPRLTCFRCGSEWKLTIPIETGLETPRANPVSEHT